MSNIKIKLYNQKAEEVGEERLDEAIFGVKVNPVLVHQAVIAQKANSRSVLAHTKDRSQVRGGGRKPWRQKGTGRARAGSTRSPIWIGGGVTFGPIKARNFSQKINKKMKQKALLMALSDRVKHEKMVLVDKIKIDKIKTKKMAGILKGFYDKVIKEDAIAKKKDNKNFKKDKSQNQGKQSVSYPKILLVLGEKDEKVIKSVRNLKKIGVIGAENLNVVDILKYEYLLTTVEAVKKIEKLYQK